MNEVFKRVSDWNEKRYAREYHKDLAVSLLREEHTEWLEATTSVDKLDALCDLVYVAMGVLWKLDVTNEVITESMEQAHIVVTNQINCNELWPAYYISTYIDVLNYDENYPAEMTAALVITSALVEMTGLGLTHKECKEAMLIVCDSNDSKTIEKVSSEVKANINKGAYFVAPEPKLNALLEKARGRLN
jgi:hypothetical protein